MTTTTTRGSDRSALGRSTAEFDEFVRETARPLYRAALLLTGGDHHLAEDLVQTTYAKVYASWRRVRRADEPVAYTRTVLTRTFLSHRRLRRSSERPTDDLPDAGHGAAPDPAPGAALHVDLVAALGRLQPHDRVVLVHRYWLDQSVAETARLLDLTETTVRTRSKRALDRLRAQLGATHPDLDLPEETP